MTNRELFLLGMGVAIGGFGTAAIAVVILAIRWAS